jgi:plastocyanin
MPARTRILTLSVALVAIVAACGGSAAPTTTFRPPVDASPGVTASAEPTPTEAPSEAASPSPTDAPPTDAPPAATGTPPAGGPTADISILDFRFSSADLTIQAGTTVTWTNKGQRPHTVTSTTAAFGTDGPLASGRTYSHRFDDVGTFTYVCTIHAAMTATITVTP